MAQNKLENDFRNKLNQREIKPSENAWDRLDAMLTVAEKPKKNYNWLYIAAGFLGFLFVGIMFFSQTEEMIDAPKTEIVNENIITNDTIKTQHPEIINQGPVKSENTAVVSETKSSIKYNNQKSSIKPVTNEALPVIENQNQTNQNQIAETPINQNQIIINQKTEQKEITKKPAYVNVDELLAAVDSKKEKSASPKPAVNVNANSLLSQVDGELEFSFRQKVIRTVNKNYRNVKVALANRNKE